ncbi:ATP-binding cassette domain-containing protein [Gordonia sp. X0973]|uniref:ATP-binding cassette domain-containing protein n=1 Tax=Gordonia sp. X0973 TaxID=2742602 RepID=UPI0026575CB0|nr:ATP-binding cassette domain-containing protein [Gordonia sp. X0973]
MGAYNEPDHRVVRAGHRSHGTDDAAAVQARPGAPEPDPGEPDTPSVRASGPAVAPASRNITPTGDPQPSTPNITPVEADSPQVYDDYYGSEPSAAGTGDLVGPAPTDAAVRPATAVAPVPQADPDPVPVRTAASRIARPRVPLSEPTIKVGGLTKSFGENTVVDGISFSVAPGTVLALLGPNGAGKTTTVNLLTTLLKPDAGTAVVAGHDVVTAAREVRRKIALTGQFAALDESLSGRENLVLFGRLQGLRKPAAQARADELLSLFDLADAGARKVSTYSGGMRRRVDLACGLVTAPEVVFLDEPTTGLDPRSRQEVWSLVERLRDQGVTILLTTQYLEEADLLADEIVVIDHGRVIAEGTAAQLKEQTGGTFCDVTPAHLAELPHLETVLADLIGAGAGHRGEVSLSIPAPTGTDVLVEIVRRTTDAGIELADITMRRPSLDDVFLALTAPGRLP